MLPALEELASLVDPQDAQHPESRAAILQVTRTLRKLLRGDRWPRAFQISGAAFCALAGDRAVIADDMGLGKQQAVDTKVLTPSGWRAIGDLRPGDFVVGSAGQPVLVTAVYPQGVKPSYRTHFSDGSSVESGPEHLWTVYYWRGGKYLSPLELTTDQLRTRPVLHPPGGRPLDLAGVELYLPILSSPVEFQKTDLPIDPYLLGQLISNGCLHCGSPVLTTGLHNWSDVLQNLTRRGTPPSSHRIYNNTVHACFSGLLPALRRLKLVTSGGDKRIPRVYMLSAVADRIALFHGLMDGDGSISAKNNRVSYSTKTLPLAEDLRELVEGLGGIATIHRYDRSHEEKGVEYMVRVRLPESVKPFTISSRASRYKPGNRAHPNRSVGRVEYVRDVESVCIEVDAADSLYATEHCILTHNTATALLRVLIGGYVPAVVVCPSSVLLNWKDEIGFWLPGAEVHRLDRVSKFVPARGWRGVVITTWDLLQHHSTALARLQPKIVVADEAHYAVNEDTYRAESFETLIAGVSHLLLLTGTPILNKTHDLWRLLHLVDPRAWPDTEFMHRSFKELNKDDFDRGMQTRLTRRIRQYTLRRVKAEATPEIVQKQYHTLRVRLPPEDMARYQKIERDFGEWLDQKIRGEVADEEQWAVVEEVSAEGWPLGEEFEIEVERRKRRALASQSLVQFGELRRLVGVLKAPLAVSWISECARAREPVVVFAQHQEPIHIIARRLAGRIPFGIIDGKTTKTRRHSLVKEFQSGKIHVLLASAAAKEGLTLTRARHVLFAERFLTAAAEDQAADRLHRIGQTRDVQVSILCAVGTVDERVDTLVGRKRRISGRTVDGPRAVPPRLLDPAPRSRIGGVGVEE